MRPYILYNEGLKVFIDKLRDESNMTGRRIAAEALNDVCSSDDFLRLKIASEVKVGDTITHVANPAKTHIKGFEDL